MRHILRRPLVAGIAGAAVLGLTGAGYAASTTGQAAPVGSLSASAQRTVQAQAVAADADAQFARTTAVQAQADHQARLEAQRLAAEQAAAAAAAAAEAQRQAEAAAQAELQRQAELERVSREATRDPRSAARVMLAEFGWGGEQFSCLESLWAKESNWSPTADNPTSSAYGIPQALPGSKMASAGADWRTNPVTQIRWGLGYIDDRYGSPCSAWSHSKAKNWY